MSCNERRRWRAIEGSRCATVLSRESGRERLEVMEHPGFCEWMAVGNERKRQIGKMRKGKEGERERNDDGDGPSRARRDEGMVTRSERGRPSGAKKES